MQFAIGADIEVILTGFQTTDTEEDTGEAEHIDTALVVVIFTGEDALDLVSTIEGLRIGDDAAKQSNEFVNIPGSVLTNEEVGAFGAIIAIVSFIDVLAEHVDSRDAIDNTGGIHLFNDIAGCIIILGDGFNRLAIGGHDVDIDLAGSRHIRIINRGLDVVAGFSGEFTFAIQQLLNHVDTHQRHTFDIVHTIEVGAEVDRAIINVTGDGKADDRVGIQISLEVRHLIQIFSDVDNSAGFAVFGQFRSSTGEHIDLVKLFFPVIEFSGSAVALVFVFENDTESVLDFNPCRLQIAGVVGLAVSKGDTFASGFSIEEQTCLRAVVTGSHAQNCTFSVRQLIRSRCHTDHHQTESEQEHKNGFAFIHIISPLFF